jgi:hypothetical protein
MLASTLLQPVQSPLIFGLRSLHYKRCLHIVGCGSIWRGYSLTWVNSVDDDSGIHLAALMEVIVIIEILIDILYI